MAETNGQQQMMEIGLTKQKRMESIGTNGNPQSPNTHFHPIPLPHPTPPLAPHPTSVPAP